MKIKILAVVILIVFFMISPLSYSQSEESRNENVQDQTLIAGNPEILPTGFVTPTGTSANFWNNCYTWPSTSGTWMGRDYDNNGCYETDWYHIGYDILTPRGYPVYAISSGIVRLISFNGWDLRSTRYNVAVLVEHRSQSGPFIGVYGHLLRSTLSVSVNQNVQAGQVIGYIGAYGTRDHLHWGVSLGADIPYSNSTSGIGFGKMRNKNWPNQNGFVDPIFFLYVNNPGQNNTTSGRDIMFADIRRITRTDSRFGGVYDNNYGEDLNWAQDTELRWVDMVFYSSLIRMYHATNKFNRRDRSYIFFNPYTNRWDGWYYCGD